MGSATAGHPYGWPPARLAAWCLAHTRVRLRCRRPGRRSALGSGVILASPIRLPREQRRVVAALALPMPFPGARGEIAPAVDLRRPGRAHDTAPALGCSAAGLVSSAGE